MKPSRIPTVSFLSSYRLKFKIKRELKSACTHSGERLEEAWQGNGSLSKDRIELSDVRVVQKIESFRNQVELSPVANWKIPEDAKVYVYWHRGLK